MCCKFSPHKKCVNQRKNSNYQVLIICICADNGLCSGHRCLASNMGAHGCSGSNYNNLRAESTRISLESDIQDPWSSLLQSSSRRQVKMDLSSSSQDLQAGGPKSWPHQSHCPHCLSLALILELSQVSIFWPLSKSDSNWSPPMTFLSQTLSLKTNKLLLGCNSVPGWCLCTGINCHHLQDVRWSFCEKGWGQKWNISWL